VTVVTGPPDTEIVVISYIRKMPNFASATGALHAAERPRANASRVVAGSSTPSSHSRAVE
jgi:hypothetical protein